MNYNIIGLDHQKHILGNFLAMNDDREKYSMFPYFNIIILDKNTIDINNEENITVSLIPNILNFQHVKSIKEVFDSFDLPYLFIEKDIIESYYE